MSELRDRFWERYSLKELRRAEWEALCDGCGKCCLHKLEDEETGKIYRTNVACRLLNIETCRCADYEHRRKWVPDCVKLTAARMRTIDWLPPTCGYRLIAEGKDLAWWHPLVSGDPDTVHQAGISVRGRALRERDAGDLEDHCVQWPGKWPAKARRNPNVTVRTTS